MRGSDGLPPYFPFDLLPSEGAKIEEAVASALGDRRSGTTPLGLHVKTENAGTEQMVVLGDPEVVTKINEVVFELVLRSGRPSLGPACRYTGASPPRSTSTPASS